jgi:hypothetical protein
MAFEHYNDSHSEGLKERVRAFMLTYQINLEQFSDLLGTERARVANWLIGAAPAPQNIHSLLFALKYPPQEDSRVRDAIAARAQEETACEDGLKRVRAI